MRVGGLVLLQVCFHRGHQVILLGLGQDQTFLVQGSTGFEGAFVRTAAAGVVPVVDIFRLLDDLLLAVDLERMPEEGGFVEGGQSLGGAHVGRGILLLVGLVVADVFAHVFQPEEPGDVAAWEEGGVEVGFGVFVLGVGGEVGQFDHQFFKKKIEEQLIIQCRLRSITVIDFAHNTTQPHSLRTKATRSCTEYAFLDRRPLIHNKQTKSSSGLGSL